MDPKETSLYNIYLITLLIIFCLLLFYTVSALIMRSRYRRATADRLTSQLNAFEKEKERICQDLHDEIGSMLTAQKLLIETITPASKHDQDVIDKVISYCDNATNKIRSLSVGLIPTVLKEKGLAIAIEQYIHNLANDTPFQITYNIDYLPPLKLQESLHIYRIVQEIIHNTLKHANAKNLSISLTDEDDILLLSTIDDGVGFASSDASSFELGYGLANINNRVQSLNATLHIFTSPGKGCRFSFEIPLTPLKIFQNEKLLNH